MLHFQTYELSEETPWLVFVHGAGGAIATWRYQTEAFKPFFNLLLLDLRDHGLSKDMNPAFSSYNFDIVCDDILEVVDHLGIEKAHFLSLSLGSAILQRLDQKRPELIDRMVMAGGVFRATLKMRALVNASQLMNLLLPYKYIYAIFSLIILPKKNHEKSRRLYRQQAKRLTQAEYMKWVGLYGEFFQVLDEYFHRQMKKLSLVVMGAEDHVFYKAARRFVAKQEKATLVVIEKCGHICNIEQWQRFNEAALQFLRGEAPGVVSAA
ncbi:MAG: alpha/beta hydrolase [Saprospiraceae bacterium]|nr:alpha/beta hydrolase [Saprospiraceae bacterium]MCF8252919.1 alpha/beta hydrolase [Saprospiraceae bacterium]MCF8281582.1 alpha/beta hydrolase [Bacteroidales bacterium]MCF8314461.1 alpha/beta hydrolase [Saprospiraceae bacterium]MCF8443350.1 alpha/beta hydrolase [Saprospiraceae bacterium]